MEQRQYWLWQKTSLPRVAKCNLSKVVSLLPEILFLLFQSQVPRDSLALSNNLKNKCITHTNAFLPPFVSRFQCQIMDMPFSRDSTQSSYHASCWNQPITGLPARISLALTLLGLVLPLFLNLYVVAFPPRYSINQSIQPTRDHPFSHPFQHLCSSAPPQKLR